MDNISPRTTRSMHGTLVNHHSSKEFLFSDPERKIKNLADDSKSKLKIYNEDAPADGKGFQKPSDGKISQKKRENPQIKLDNERKVLIDSQESRLFGSNNETNESSGCDIEYHLEFLDT